MGGLYLYFFVFYQRVCVRGGEGRGGPYVLMLLEYNSTHFLTIFFKEVIVNVNGSV